MDPILKREFMVKRSLRKGKYLKIDNYKERWFVLSQRYLRYYDGAIESGVGKMKGEIRLSDVIVVDFTDDTILGKSDVFQVIYSAPGANVTNTLTLYIKASQAAQRESWVAALRTACRDNGVNLASEYHPGLYLNGCYNCCNCAIVRSAGCKACDLLSSAPPPPPPPSEAETFLRSTGRSKENELNNKDSISPPSRPRCPLPVPPKLKTANIIKKKAVALYDWDPEESGDLYLIEGHEYEILDDRDKIWWKAKNKDGDTGMLPSNYVVLTPVHSELDHRFSQHDWYYCDITRTDAEEQLKRNGSNGCFMVRNSQKSGKYTLSYLSIPPGQVGKVHHFHISTTREGFFYLTESHTFPDIDDLVAYYRRHRVDTHTTLCSPPCATSLKSTKN